MPYRLRKYKSTIALLAIAAFFVCLLSGCTAQKENVFFNTDFSLEIKGSGALSRSKKIESMLEELENTLSASIAASDISRINDAEVGVPVSVGKDFVYLYTASMILHESFPSYNPFIFPMVELWNFDPEGFTLSPSGIPSSQEIQDLLGLCNKDSFSFNEQASTITKLRTGAKLDFGAIAKGYAADKAAEIADNTKYVVNIGGTIRTNKKIEVAIVSPRNNGYAASFVLDNGAVATSGDYERFYLYQDTRYHHIIGADGYPAGIGETETVVSATVVGPEAAMCDALSTLVFIEGETTKDFIEALGYSALILTETTYKTIGDVRFELLEPREAA